MWRMTKIAIKKGGKFFSKLKTKWNQNPLTLKERWKLGTYRTDRLILKHIFETINFIVFIVLMIASLVAEQTLVDFINGSNALKYSILIWVFWYFIFWTLYCKNLAKEANNIWFTIIVTFLNIITFLPTWIKMGLLVSHLPNVITLCIAIAFCLFPLYYLVLSLFEIVQSPPLRSLTGIIFSAVLIEYTFKIFSIYNAYYPVIGEETKIINLIIEVITGKSPDISQLTLSDIGKLRFDHIMQAILMFWESIVIKDILKVASNPLKISKDNEQAQ
jgi:hypothetical protein